MKNKVFFGVILGLIGLMVTVAFATTFIDTYDKTTPKGTDAPSVLDNRIREIKLAIQERLNVDHYWPYASVADVAGGNEVASAYSGEHRMLTFYGNITDPTQVTGKAHLYKKGGELYYQDASNTALQLTNGGVLYSGVGLTVVGNATIGGTLDVTGNIDPTSYETTNGGFKDEDSMASASATNIYSGESIKAYIDAQIAANIGTAGQWHHDGTKVYNTNAPTTFTDLDLSAYVGSNRALVYLKVKNVSGSARDYKFRENGETDTQATTSKGTSNARLGPDKYVYLMVETDANGIIEWLCDVAADTDIWLKGYVK